MLRLVPLDRPPEEQSQPIGAGTGDLRPAQNAAGTRPVPSVTLQLRTQLRKPQEE